MSDQPIPPPATPVNPAPAPKKHRHIGRIILIIVGVIVVLILIAIPFVPMTVRAILRHEITVQVAGNLNARLNIDTLIWHPLLGVEIGHATLVTPGPDNAEIPVAEISGLKVNLAAVPTGGPIVVDNLTLLDPTIDLVRLPSGELQVQKNFVLASPQPAPAGPSEKISQMVEIEHLNIQNMTVRLSDYKSSTPPVVAKINVQSDLSGGPSTYNLHVTVAQDPMTHLTFDGTADVDGATMTFKNFAFMGQLPAGEQLAAMPRSIQDLCRQYGIAGAGATITLADGAAVTVDSDKNRWQLRGFNGDIKLASSASPAVVGGVIHFKATGGGPLPASNVPAGLGYLKAIDPDSSIAISADSSDKPMIALGLLPQPVSQVGGSIQFTGGKLTMQDVQLNYGSLPVQVQAAGTLDARKAALQNLQVNIAHGSLQIDNAQVALTAPYDCSAKLHYEKIDLKELKTVLPINDPGGHISGEAHGELTISGPIAKPRTSVLATIQGDGKTHVENADFWDLPVFSDVIGRVAPNIGGLGRIGDAAAVYSFKDGKLTIVKAAVGCPVIGVQATGDIGLVGDNPLNVHLVIAPLGDWKKQTDKVGIPVLSQVFGQAQKAFNKVQSQMLAFDVTGPAAHYQFKAVPAPALAGDAKDIFGDMMNGAQKGGNGLLDLIQRKSGDDNSNH